KDVERLVEVDGELLFFINTANTRTLWYLDVGIAKKVGVQTFTEAPENLNSIGDRLYFTTGAGATTSLWTSVVSNGTPATPTSISTGLNSPVGFQVVGQRLYFTQNGELSYATGTTVSKPGAASYLDGSTDLEKTANLNGLIYYTVDATGAVELWRTTWDAASGSAGPGAQKVKTLATGTTNGATLGAANGAVYFTLLDGTQNELWRTDGTADGTVKVGDLSGSTKLVGIDSQFKVRMIRDASITTDQALASFANGVLTIRFNQELTKLASIENAITGLFGFAVTRAGDGLFAGTDVTVQGGINAGYASFSVEPTGANNDFIVRASSDGPDWNDQVLKLVHDAAAAAGDVTVSYDGVPLTIAASADSSVVFNVPTDRIKSHMRFGISVNGTGHVFNLDSIDAGDGSSLAAKLNSDTDFSTAGLSAAWNAAAGTLTVTSGPGVLLSAPFLSGRTITVTFDRTETSAADVVAAINTLDDWNAKLDSSEANNTGAGFIDTATQTTIAVSSGGVTGRSSTAAFRLPGVNNDLVFSSDRLTGADHIGATIRITDTGEISNGTATATYDSGTKVLTIDLQSGTTPATEIVAALAGIPEFSAAIDASVELFNDGQGVVHLVPITEVVGQATLTADGVGNSLEIVRSSVLLKIDNGGQPELWRIVGDGLEKLADLPGLGAFATAVDESLYFVTNNEVSFSKTPPSLWKSETDTSGNITFRQLTTLPGKVMKTAAVGDRLYLVLDPDTATNREDLWVSYQNADGAQVTQFIRSFDGSVTEMTAMDEASYLTIGSRTTERSVRVEGMLFLSVDFTSRREVWRILDNTEEYTAGRVFSSSDSVAQLTVVRNTLYFVENNKTVHRVGATAETATKFFGSTPNVTSLTAVGGTLYFNGSTTAAATLLASKVLNGDQFYSIITWSSFAGETHAESDRDTLKGGEGADILIGNGDQDALFGESGIDVFIGEAFEKRDLSTGEQSVEGNPAEDASIQPRPRDNRVFIFDTELRAAIARALSLAVTAGYNNQSVTQESFRASELFKVTSLNAGDLGITDLRGLKYLSNLQNLNLGGNDIANLLELQPGLDSVTGAAIGMTDLRYLALDGNKNTTDLSLAALTHQQLRESLLAVSFDDNNFSDTTYFDVIKGLDALRFVSADNNTPAITTNTIAEKTTGTTTVTSTDGHQDVLASGTLILNGGNNASGRLDQDGSADVAEEFRVRKAGANYIVDFYRNGVLSKTAAYTGISAIYFDGGVGDDILNIDASVDVKVIAYGGAGDDQLRGGSADGNYLNGGIGNDVLTSTSGDETLVGGKGDDHYVFGSNWGTDSIIELTDEGDDTLDLRALGNGEDVTVTIGTETVSGTNKITHTGNRIENVLTNASATSTRTLRVAQTSEQAVLTGTQLTLGTAAAINYSGFNRMELLLPGGQVKVSGEVDLAGDLVIRTGTLTLEADVRAVGMLLDLSNPFTVTQPATTSNGSGSPILLEATGLRILHDGGVGLADQPVFIKVQNLEVITRGNTANAAGVYLIELDGLTVGNVDVTGYTDSDSGIQTRGGDVSILNLTGNLRVTSHAPASVPGIEAWGGDIVLTSDLLQIDANVRSWWQGITGGSDQARGALVLQPLNVFTSIGVGGAATGTFHLTNTELDRIINGFGSTAADSFDGITIGRADGRHGVKVGQYAYRDSVTIRAPRAPGHIDVLGVLSTVGTARLHFVGSFSTTVLSADVYTNGDNKLFDDSVRVGAGKDIVISTGPLGGDITIEGRLDGVVDTSGTGGTNANESLTIIAGTGDLVIKGDIGGLEPLQDLTIISAGSVTIQGSVNVRGTFKVVSASGVVDIGVPLTSGGAVGNVTVGKIDIATSSNVIFEGNVTTTNSAADSIRLSTIGDITFKQNLTTAGGVLVETVDDLVVNGTTNVAGILEQRAGTTSTVFNGPVTANAYDLTTKDLNFDSTLSVNSAGTVLLTADEINFKGGAGSVTSAGVDNSVITLRPTSSVVPINLGVAAGTNPDELDLSADDLAAINAKFQELRIGWESATNPASAGETALTAVSSGGGDLTPAKVTIVSPGDKNDLVFTAGTSGAVMNDVLVRIYDDGTVTGNNANATWHAGTKELLVNVSLTNTTALTVKTKVNA
ncbi:MAG: hypothetical protein ACPGVU_16050, partial [Limisphaerales bacterium]